MAKERYVVLAEDVLFFVMLFLGLAVFMVIVNVTTGTWRGISGHALATVLAALILVKYRWKDAIPGRPMRVGFSLVAGLSAIVYLYLLQIVASLSPWLAFEALRGYELLMAFAVSALVFAGTLWVRTWMLMKRED